MKHFLKYTFLLFLVMASSKMAHASVLDGTLTFSGSGQSSSTGIVFTSGKVASQGTGDLSSFNAGHPATFANPFTFALIPATPGGELMFTVGNLGNTQKLMFKVTSYSMSGGKLTFFGVLSLYNHVEGRDTLISSDTATLAYTQLGDGKFTASIGTAPEPNSLLLLGTGLVGVAGIMLRRRQTVQTV